MIIRRVFFMLTLATNFSLWSQKSPTSNYRSPLDIPLELAANFGEIRPDHFHMGVDFKTGGKEGLKLYAIENGFVSRIKVSPDGYGKSVYIDHPDGRTSVYAHCSEFKGKIDSLTKLIQRAEENFEVDIYLRSEDILVKKGQIIALSGNTGHSFAPHLHFEIRDTKTEDALNPLLFGFNVQDHKKPEIRSLKIHALTEEGYIIPGKSIEQKVVQHSQDYTLEKGTVYLSESFFEQGPIGISVMSSDHFDRGNNTCGIYSSALKSNGKLIFSQRMDRISFEQTRFVNDHVDLEAYTQRKQEFQKAFKSQSNPLGIYSDQLSGRIYIQPGETIPFELTLMDLHRNSSTLAFKLSRTGRSQSKTPFYGTGKYFHPDSSYFFQDSKHVVNILKNTFYQPVLKIVEMSDNEIRISDAKNSIQLPIELSFKLSDSLPDPEKYYISRTGKNGKESSIECMLVNDWITGNTKNTGLFHLRKDVSPPKVVPLGFSSGSKVNQSILKWKVSDSSTEITDYDLFIDGQWHLIELEKKGSFLLFKKPSGMKGKKNLELRVTDQCGNNAFWRGTLNF